LDEKEREIVFVDCLRLPILTPSDYSLCYNVINDSLFIDCQNKGLVENNLDKNALKRDSKDLVTLWT